jgi:arsenate reductase
MAELGIDIRGQQSKAVREFEGRQFDLVITVCDSAQEQCPFFPGATRMLHVGFPDPGRASGTEAEIMAVFRRVRDDMREKLLPLLAAEVKKS